MIDGNELRAAFAEYLSTHTHTRWGLDAALMHVCKIAYEQGLKDGASAPPINQQGNPIMSVKQQLPKEIQTIIDQMQAAGIDVKVVDFGQFNAAPNVEGTEQDGDPAFPDVLELESKITRLEAHNKKMLDELIYARGLFSQYALHHLTKPNVDSLSKAVTNIDAAMRMNKAIVG